MRFCLQAKHDYAKRRRRRYLDGSNMSDSRRALARRYAKALFELAQEKKVLEKVEKDLTALKGLLTTSDDVKKVIGRPILSRENQTEFMDRLLQKAKAEKVTQNFVALLAKNRRLTIALDIINAFFEKLRQYRGEKMATITTATPLDKNQVQTIESSLSKTLDQKIIAENKVNADMLGGVTIQIGSKMLDNSLSGKIDKLTLLTKEAISDARQ